MAKIYRQSAKISTMDDNALYGYSMKGLSECKAAAQEAIRRGDDGLIQAILQSTFDSGRVQPDQQLMAMFLSYISKNISKSDPAKIIEMGWDLLEYSREALSSLNEGDLISVFTATPTLTAAALLSGNTPPSVTQNLMDALKLIQAPYLGKEFNSKVVQPEQHNEVLKQMLILADANRGIAWDNETSAIRFASRLLMNPQDKFMTEAASANIGAELTNLLIEAGKKTPMSTFVSNLKNNESPIVEIVRKMKSNSSVDFWDISNAASSLTKGGNKRMTRWLWNELKKISSQSKETLGLLFEEPPSTSVIGNFWKMLPESKTDAAKLFLLAVNTVLRNDLATQTIFEYLKLLFSETETREILLKNLSREQFDQMLMTPELRQIVYRYLGVEEGEGNENEEAATSSYEDTDDEYEFDVLSSLKGVNWYKRAAKEYNAPKELYEAKYIDVPIDKTKNKNVYIAPTAPQKPKKSMGINEPWYNLDIASNPDNPKSHYKTLSAIIQIARDRGIADDVAIAAAKNPNMDKRLLQSLIGIGVLFGGSPDDFTVALAEAALANDNCPPEMIEQVLARGVDDRASRIAVKSVFCDNLDEAIWRFRVGETEPLFSKISMFEGGKEGDKTLATIWGVIEQALSSGKLNEETVIVNLFQYYEGARTLYLYVPESRQRLLDMLLKLTDVKHEYEFNGWVKTLISYDEERNISDGLLSQKWLSKITEDQTLAKRFGEALKYAIGEEGVDNLLMTPQQREAITEAPQEDDYNEDEYEFDVLSSNKGKNWYKTAIDETEGMTEEELREIYDNSDNAITTNLPVLHNKNCPPDILRDAADKLMAKIREKPNTGLLHGHYLGCDLFRNPNVSPDLIADIIDLAVEGENQHLASSLAATIEKDLVENIEAVVKEVLRHSLEKKPTVNGPYSFKIFEAALHHRTAPNELVGQIADERLFGYLAAISSPWCPIEVVRKYLRPDNDDVATTAAALKSPNLTDDDLMNFVKARSSLGSETMKDLVSETVRRLSAEQIEELLRTENNPDVLKWAIHSRKFSPEALTDFLNRRLVNEATAHAVEFHTNSEEELRNAIRWGALTPVGFGAMKNKKCPLDAKIFFYAARKKIPNLYELLKKAKGDELLGLADEGTALTQECVVKAWEAITSVEALDEEANAFVFNDYEMFKLFSEKIPNFNYEAAQLLASMDYPTVNPKIPAMFLLEAEVFNNEELRNNLFDAIGPKSVMKVPLTPDVRDAALNYYVSRGEVLPAEWVGTPEPEDIEEDYEFDILSSNKGKTWYKRATNEIPQPAAIPEWFDKEIASDPDTDPEILAKILQFDLEKLPEGPRAFQAGTVIERAADNPSTPSEVLRKFYLDRRDMPSLTNANWPLPLEKSLVLEVIRNESFPVELLTEIYNDPNSPSILLNSIAVNKNCPPDILRGIYNKTYTEDDREVKFAPTRNLNCPPDILRDAATTFIAQPESLLANVNLKYIFMHKNATPDILGDIIVASLDPKRPSNLARDLSESSEPDPTKPAVSYIENPKIPREAIEEILIDSINNDKHGRRFLFAGAVKHPNAPEKLVGRIASKQFPLPNYQLAISSPRCPIEIVRSYLQPISKSRDLSEIISAISNPQVTVGDLLRVVHSYDSKEWKDDGAYIRDDDFNKLPDPGNGIEAATLALRRLPVEEIDKILKTEDDDKILELTVKTDRYSQAGLASLIDRQLVNAATVYAVRAADCPPEALRDAITWGRDTIVGNAAMSNGRCPADARISHLATSEQFQPTLPELLKVTLNAERTTNETLDAGFEAFQASAKPNSMAAVPAIARNLWKTWQKQYPNGYKPFTQECVVDAWNAFKRHAASEDPNRIKNCMSIFDDAEIFKLFSERIPNFNYEAAQILVQISFEGEDLVDADIIAMFLSYPQVFNDKELRNGLFDLLGLRNIMNVSLTREAREAALRYYELKGESLPTEWIYDKPQEEKEDDEYEFDVLSSKGRTWYKTAQIQDEAPTWFNVETASNPDTDPEILAKILQSASPRPDEEEKDIIWLAANNTSTPGDALGQFFRECIDPANSLLAESTYTKELQEAIKNKSFPIDLLREICSDVDAVPAHLVAALENENCPVDLLRAETDENIEIINNSQFDRLLNSQYLEAIFNNKNATPDMIADIITAALQVGRGENWSLPERVCNFWENWSKIPRESIEEILTQTPSNSILGLMKAAINHQKAPEELVGKLTDVQAGVDNPIAIEAAIEALKSPRCPIEIVKKHLDPDGSYEKIFAALSNPKLTDEDLLTFIQSEKIIKAPLATLRQDNFGPTVVVMALNRLSQNAIDEILKTEDKEKLLEWTVKTNRYSLRGLTNLIDRQLINEATKYVLGKESCPPDILRSAIEWGKGTTVVGWAISNPKCPVDTKISALAEFFDFQPAIYKLLKTTLISDKKTNEALKLDPETSSLTQECIIQTWAAVKRPVEASARPRMADRMFVFNDPDMFELFSKQVPNFNYEAAQFLVEAAERYPKDVGDISPPLLANILLSSEVFGNEELRNGLFDMLGSRNIMNVPLPPEIRDAALDYYVSKGETLPAEWIEKPQEEVDEYEFDILSFVKDDFNWYKTSKTLAYLEKEAAMFDRAKLLSAVLMVLMGTEMAIAASKANVSEAALSEAVQNPAVVQEAKNLAAEQPKTIDERIADSPQIQENIIARTIFREGVAEDWKGKVAIATTIWNRGDGDPLKMVQAIRKRKQFSCWNKASEQDWVSLKEYSGESWEHSKKIAKALMNGKFTPPHDYTHYYNPEKVKEKPNWAYHTDKKQRHLPYEQIGSHRFLHGR